LEKKEEKKGKKEKGQKKCFEGNVIEEKKIIK